MQKWGVYFLLVSGFLGIWSSHFLGLDFVFLLSSFILVLSLIFCFRFKEEISFFVFVIVGAGLIMLGAFLYEVSFTKFNKQNLALPDGELINMKAEVFGLPDDRGSKVFYKVRLLDVGGSPVYGNARVSTDDPDRFFAGDVVSMYGKLEKPESFVGENGIVFDYPKFLQKDNISRIVSFPDEIDLIFRPEVSFGRFIAKTREFIFSRMSYVFGEPVGSLSSGMVFGKKSGLGEDLTEDFRETGLSHILVFSGFNLTLLVAVGAGLFKNISRRIFIIFSLVLILFFIFVSGAEAPALRAGVMALVSIYAVSIGSEYRPLNALLFGISILACVSPMSAIYDASFHLSALATAGLVFFTPIFVNLFSRFPEFLKEAISTTLSAQVAVLPFVLGLSGQVSLIGIILNVLFAPVIPLLVILALAIFILSLVSLPVAIFFGQIFTHVSEWFLEAISFFADLPFASVFVEAKNSTIIFIYCILIAVYIFWERGRIKEVSQNDLPQQTN